VRRAETRTFASGSFGWHTCTGHPVNVKVAGEGVLVIVNFLAVLRGTKPDGRPGGEDHDSLALFDAEMPPSKPNARFNNGRLALDDVETPPSKPIERGKNSRLALDDAETPPKRLRLEKDLLCIANVHTKNGMLASDDARAPASFALQLLRHPHQRLSWEFANMLEEHFRLIRLIPVCIHWLRLPLPGHSLATFLFAQPCELAYIYEVRLAIRCAGLRCLYSHTHRQ